MNKYTNDTSDSDDYSQEEEIQNVDIADERFSPSDRELYLHYRYILIDKMSEINGFSNPGNYCFLNASLQLFNRIPHFIQLLQLERDEFPELEVIRAALTELNNKRARSIDIASITNERDPENNYNVQTDIHK